MRAKLAAITGTVLLILCVMVLVSLNSARRHRITLDYFGADIPDSAYSSAHLEFDPEFHGLAAVVWVSIADVRFREEFAARVSGFPDLAGYPVPPPARGILRPPGPMPLRQVIWTLPVPVFERFSVRQMEWVRDPDPSTQERESAAKAILDREARIWLEEQAPLWRERSIEERARRLELRRLSLAVRRASSDRLTISENWGEHRPEDWGEHNARFDRIEAVLDRLLRLVESLSEPLPGQFTILLEGDPAAPGERKCTDAVDTAEELRALVARTSPTEHRIDFLGHCASVISRETGVRCEFSTQGRLPEGHEAPDLDPLHSVLEESGLLSRDLGQIDYTEFWSDHQPPSFFLSAHDGSDLSGNRPILREPLLPGTGRGELEAWCRKVAALLPEITEETRDNRKRHRLHGDRSRRVRYDLIASRTEFDARKRGWPSSTFAHLLLPGLPYWIEWSDRGATLALDGRSTGEIQFDPIESFLDRWLEAHSLLLRDSPSNARRAAILAERDRIERNLLDSRIAIEPANDISNPMLERTLHVVGIALARAPADAWYRREPFWEMRLTNRHAGFDETARPRPLEVLSVAILHVPAYGERDLLATYQPWDRPETVRQYSERTWISTPEWVERLLRSNPRLEYNRSGFRRNRP